jgi:hypothetical protein
MSLRQQIGVNWGQAAAVLGLAAMGGALGASILWVATGRLGLSGAGIGLVVTAVGWFISARLTERAQTRLFQHNIINTARLDLTTQIREEQEWIGQLLGLGFRYRGALINRKSQVAPLDANVERLFWIDQSRVGHAILYRQQRPGRTLTMLLEEYELLFPETTRVRHQLSRLSQEIVRRYSIWLHDLYDLSRCEATIVTLEGRLGTEDGDYSALLEDLRLHIQNSALSKITGRRVDLRKPQDPKLPIMIMQSDGLLDIVQDGNSWPIMTEEHAKLMKRESVYWAP